VYVSRVSVCLSVCLYAGYLKQVYRADDFVVVCHVPELSEADLPTLSWKRKYSSQNDEIMSVIYNPCLVIRLCAGARAMRLEVAC